jgi:hypothetical protein
MGSIVNALSPYHDLGWIKYRCRLSRHQVLDSCTASCHSHQWPHLKQSVTTEISMMTDSCGSSSLVFCVMVTCDPRTREIRFDMRLACLIMEEVFAVISWICNWFVGKRLPIGKGNLCYLSQSQNHVSYECDVDCTTGCRRVESIWTQFSITFLA